MRTTRRILLILAVLFNSFALYYYVRLWQIELRVFNQTSRWWVMPTLLTPAPILSLLLLFWRPSRR
jgi:hypothetical protein